MAIYPLMFNFVDYKRFSMSKKGSEKNTKNKAKHSKLIAQKKTKRNRKKL